MNATELQKVGGRRRREGEDEQEKEAKGEKEGENRRRRGKRRKTKKEVDECDGITKSGSRHEGKDTSRERKKEEPRE